MENESTPAPEKKSSSMPIIITIAVIAIILVGVVMYMMNNNSNQAATDQQPTQTNEAMEAQPTSEVMTSEFADGTYNAEGMYVSPGGEESIDVTVTLVDGVVTDAIVVSNATRPISKQMQTSFIDGFREQVVGQPIDQINLVKVSASSLAPKGFNDALTKIKAEAQAAS